MSSAQTSEPEVSNVTKLRYTMDNQITQGIERGVQGLSICKNDGTTSHGQSLVTNPYFQHFYGKKEIDERGFTHFEQVVKFQEPMALSLLLDCKPFLEKVKASEPGRTLSYRALHVDLMKVQDEVQGGGPAVQKMFDFVNDLGRKHKYFVTMSGALAGLELYNEIILRQYGIVQDHEFTSLPEFQSLLYAISFHDEAPPYAEVQANIDDTLQSFQNCVQYGARELENLKNSIDFKTFRAKLTTAQQVHQSKLDRTERAAQRTAYETSVDFIRRLAETKAKNERMTERRIKKNISVKNINLGNVHQLGNMTRTPLSAAVVQALSALQVSHEGMIFDTALDDGKKTQGDAGEENATTNGNGQQPEEFKVESIQDVELPEGFENVALPVPPNHFN